MQIRKNVIQIVSNLSGRGESQAEWVVLLVLGYLILLIVLLYIHSKLLKKQKNIQKNLVFLYDTIRYQLAKVQYETLTNTENEGINKIITADHKTYLANAKAIKQEILAIEQKNAQKIISTAQRKVIHKETRKKNILEIGVQGIGRISTIFTAGIYKLFR